MHHLEILLSGDYKEAGLTQLKLTCPLDSFPEQILELGETLEQLELSGTGLSSLPSNLGSSLPKLKTALFSDCNFKVFPKELASCLNLETVAFRNNGIEEIPRDALPRSLRCLVLTNNLLTFLPSDIGRCEQLQQLLVAGNQLRELPTEMARCKKLQVLRLSSNCLETLPSWAFTLPKLASLSFSSNPCASPIANGVSARRFMANIPWSDLEIQQMPNGGEDESQSRSAITSPGLWKQSPDYAEEVSIKLFRGSRPTDDGHPADELAAWLAAGAHESLITILGRIQGHPDEAAPETQETYHGGLASCLHHLHSRGIAHGNLTSAAILASTELQHAVLRDFAAATIYRASSAAKENQKGIERIEVLAFGRVMEHILGLVGRDEREGEEGRENDVEKGLRELVTKCVRERVRGEA
ncbi:hypothetical protein N0V88_004880 [Collariella sp. IMI 366227]|nr:hypothetical protein N0V88_004880 [Collariella sp. IMI 366227]